MQATTNQAMPLADNRATPLADNRATPLADNRAMPLAENNSQAARAADTHMAMLLAVYTAQNNTNAKSAAELVGAQSEALDATWGNRATPQQMNGARNLSESFSAAKQSQKLSTRVEIMMEQEQNCSKIASMMSELRDRGEKLEDEKRRIKHERDEAVNKFHQLQMTLRSLESFAEDTVRENKAQQEKIAERDSHIMILSETCRDIQKQLVEF